MHVHVHFSAVKFKFNSCFTWFLRQLILRNIIKIAAKLQVPTKLTLLKNNIAFSSVSTHQGRRRNDELYWLVDLKALWPKKAHLYYICSVNRYHFCVVLGVLCRLQMCNKAPAVRMAENGTCTFPLRVEKNRIWAGWQKMRPSEGSRMGSLKRQLPICGSILWRQTDRQTDKLKRRTVANFGLFKNG